MSRRRLRMNTRKKTVPTQCPLEFYGISCMVGMTRAFYLILRTRFYPERQNAAKLEWALCGHCVGTVWALCGHCVGTVLPRLMRKLLLRVRASPALDGRQRQPGRRTHTKKNRRIAQQTHEARQHVARHIVHMCRPQPDRWTCLRHPPNGRLPGNHKKQTDFATKRGAAAHSKSPFR